MTRLYCFTFLISALSFSAKAMDFIQVADSLKTLPQKEFLNQFPFEQYLEGGTPDDVKLMETHRRYLDSLGLDGDRFIMKLYEEFLKTRPLDFQNAKQINRQLQLGELMSNSEKYMPDSVFVYSALGIMIFSRIADTLEVLINKGEVDKNDFEIRYILARLAENQYAIDISTSNFSKLWKNLKECNCDYIWHKSITTYFREFKIFLVFSFFSLAGLLWLSYKYRQYRLLEKVGAGAGLAIIFSVLYCLLG